MTISNSNLNPLPPAEEHINKPKHSGGPKTPEGKARSAINAYKHGLYSTRHALLKTESVEAYQAHLSAYYARYCPAGQRALEKPLLNYLARRIASLVCQRTASLKALSDLRKNHPNLDPNPGTLPIPFTPSPCRTTRD